MFFTMKILMKIIRYFGLFLAFAFSLELVSFLSPLFQYIKYGMWGKPINQPLPNTEIAVPYFERLGFPYFLSLGINYFLTYLYLFSLVFILSFFIIKLLVVLSRWYNNVLYERKNKLVPNTDKLNYVVCVLTLCLFFIRVFYVQTV